MPADETLHVAMDVDTENPPTSTEPSAPSAAANGKRKAESELDRALKKSSPTSDEEQDAIADEAAGPPQQSNDADDANDTPTTPLSKNQLKRLRRQQQWEGFKQDRRAKRKDKRHERQARKRAEKETMIAEAEAAGIDPATVLQQKEPWKFRPVPISFIIDCDFEIYMREQELVSLSSQLVRSYAMNRKAKYQASLHFSSWKGMLKTRFETVFKNAHQNWKNVGFHEGDFREAAKQAREQMSGPQGGEIFDLIDPNKVPEGQSSNGGESATSLTVEAEPEAEDVDRSVVYLTSESPYTLDRLEANTSYVIGGIVDKNREKGLCYKRARDYKVRTAKLPIGEYMAMQSRYVLTTNQVVEIMAKWLECGDWGKAFMDVIPKRKGGTLKGEAAEGLAANGDDDGADEEDDGEVGELADPPSPRGADGAQAV
ncbi:guanine-1-methyltransferase-domain-containing protein [Staphylotrichum tortipilum]|uniref:tRNA (guanine(9)-N1)-methyltransferase n=1 Tax=Staphylotrichum tortipilum TaxID=2831512 RepID=A0AAN6RVU4_9PEZI|nr:guanine-1-methyltransferase-domain-containing protein [Staphylotrichum longicolle]